MQTRTTLARFFVVISVIVLGLYLYTASQLRYTRSGVSENIAQLHELKRTLTKQLDDLRTGLIPEMRGLLKEKVSKENLLQQATALHQMKSLIPIIHAFPIPKFPAPVRESLLSLFNALDPLLRNTLRDLQSLEHDIEQIIAHIDRIVALEEEALAELKKLTPTKVLLRYLEV